MKTPRLIQLTPDADPRAVKGALTSLGLWPAALQDERGEVSAYTLDASSVPVTEERLKRIEGVGAVLSTPSPHPLIDKQARRPLRVAGHLFNQAGAAPLLISGPCSIETEPLAFEVASHVASAGGQWLRGGAYKPRTSPYAFQGRGEEGLKWLRAAADEHGLKVVTEALSEQSVQQVAAWSDVLQIGTRNMQNFSLLKAVGATGRPVLLKRGLCATVEEWLLAGEYLLAHGAEAVVFCERGLRSFDSQTRNLLDLGAVALLKHSYGQPVIVDPSHAAGRRDLIAPLAKAALAVGADGVMIEAHPNAAEAMSDGPQALNRAELSALGVALRQLSPQLAPEGAVEGTREGATPEGEDLNITLSEAGVTPMSAR